MQNYPPCLYGETCPTNTVLRIQAEELAVPFVDNEVLFRALYSKGYEQLDYHARAGGLPEGHFNAKGYEAMAGFIYDKIMEQGFMQDKS